MSGNFTYTVNVDKMLLVGTKLIKYLAISASFAGSKKNCLIEIIEGLSNILSYL